VYFSSHCLTNRQGDQSSTQCENGHDRCQNNELCTGMSKWNIPGHTFHIVIGRTIGVLLFGSCTATRTPVKMLENSNRSGDWEHT
jgi:hypothetical protein